MARWSVSLGRENIRDNMTENEPHENKIMEDLIGHVLEHVLP